MALKIGNLDERQSKIVLIAGGLTALALVGLVLYNRLRGGNAATATPPTTAASDTSSQQPATLQGVTEIYYAPGNLGQPPTSQIPVDPPITQLPLPNRGVNPPPPPLPQPNPAPPVAAPPPPTQTPAPQAQRTFVVKPWPQPGSSLWTISQIEYGQSSQAHVNAIAQANHIPNPDLIHPGQVLVIP